jgi:ribosome maturation factor RimP
VLDEEIVAELEAIAAGAGCELVHAELKGGTLRLFIDRPDGVDLADCETISRQVSAFLDVVDFGAGRYLLEVSSPGLDRRLYRPRDWVRFTGSKVRVTFRSPETGQKRTVVGRLTGFEPGPGPRDGTAVVETETGERLVLGLGDVQVARLEIDL